MAFKSSDGLQLFTQNWEVKAPKAVVALVHGLGEHCLRYAHWAKMFNTEGYAMMAMDVRGHGQSEGKKGFTPNYEQLLTDIDCFLQEVRIAYPEKKIILYGHSLGANQVLNFFVRKNPNIAAVVSSAAFITLAFKPNPIVYAIGKWSKNWIPGLTQGNQLIVEHLSKDKAVVEAYKNDPLNHDRLSSMLGISCIEAGQYLLSEKFDIKTPLLLLHGADDKTTNPSGTMEFYQNTTGDRTLKIFSNLLHEIHNEPEQKEVFNYIMNWFREKNL